MGRLSLVDPGDVGTSSLAREALAAAWAARGRSVDRNVYRRWPAIRGHCGS
jgi:hypothetical protein